MNRERKRKEKVFRQETELRHEGNVERRAGEAMEIAGEARESGSVENCSG